VDGAAATERVGGLSEVRPFRDVGFAEAEALAGAGRASCLPTHAAMRLRHGWGTRHSAKKDVD